MKTLYTIAFAILIVATTSCKKYGYENSTIERIVVMRSYSMNKVASIDGPPEVKKGAYDGCFTAHWARGNPFYKFFSYYKQDPELLSNELYKFVWHRSYNVCFQMVNRDTYMQLGARVVQNRLSGFFDFRDSKNWVGLTVGGNQNYTAKIPFGDLNASDGIIGTKNNNKSGNFYGAWGTCQFCSN
jgi:hypothetical protein